MPIRFAYATLHDNNRAMSLEDIFRLRGTFAGIHDFNFDSLVDSNFTDESEWEAVSSAWTLDTNTAVASGTGTDYGVLWHDQETQASFKIKVETGFWHYDGTCIVFRGDGDDDFFLAEINHDSVGFYQVEGGTPTTLAEMSVVNDLSGPHLIEVAVSQEQYSEYDNDRFLFMSLLIDDTVVLVARKLISDSVPGLKWGLGVSPGEVAYFRSVRIPDLSNIIMWASLDPDETSGDSVRRAIGDRVINYFVRGNGELRAWKPKATDPVYTFPADTEFKFVRDLDAREVITRVRMQYASGWVEAFDPELYHKYGHRFREIYNADIYHKDEAYEEALAVLRRSKEEATRCTFIARNVGFLLEPEDHIVLPNGEHYIIESISFNVKAGVTVTIKGRLYAF